MTDADRFAALLLREAASYNRPPATPAGAMWQRVEGRLGVAGADLDLEAEVGDEAAGAGGPMFEALAYNASPPVPREAMWTRIEAAWALRRSVGGDGAEPVARAGARWPARRGGKGWLAALAAAASLVLGIALGRGARPGLPAETAPPPAASVSGGVTAPAASPATVAERELRKTDDSGTPAGEAGLAGRVAAVGGPLRAGEADAPRMAAAGPRPEPLATPNNASGAESAPAVALLGPAPGGIPDGRSLPEGGRVEPELDYATARHLGRAATLLTAFRTDRRTPASRLDLARWARGLLVETRMFLELSSESGLPVEHALLEDLELVLIQIAGMGPGAPDFEWDLARESMERRGTLVRLRAASAAAET
ncbi:MAG: hypothetical protein OXU64_07015 [Gemmatimonadota bacterium]|nr:hypothetical protein [Gemmatimonadota bacterium]